MESTIKERLADFISAQKLSINKFEKECGLSTGYVRNMRKSISPDKLRNIVQKFPELNPGWLMTGEGNMLRESTDNNSGIVISGNNKLENSSIHNDHRYYYSDSPDVLKAQINLLDERIKEKDAQIKEKDAQIKKLLDILASK